MFKLYTSSLVIFFWLFIFWALLAFVDFITASKWQLTGGFSVVWSSSVDRWTNWTRALVAFGKKYRWFTPLLVFIFMLSPLLALFFVFLDIGRLVAMIMFPAYRAQAGARIPTAPQGPIPNNREEIVVGGEGFKEVDETITYPQLVDGKLKYPDNWSSIDRATYRRLPDEDKARVSQLTRTATPRLRPLFLDIDGGEIKLPPMAPPKKED